MQNRHGRSEKGKIPVKGSNILSFFPSVLFVLKFSLDRVRHTHIYTYIPALERVGKYQSLQAGGVQTVAKE